MIFCLQKLQTDLILHFQTQKPSYPDSATMPDKPTSESNAATSGGTVPDQSLAATPASHVSTLPESVTTTDTNHMPTVESSTTNVTSALSVSVTTSASETL